MNHYTGLKDKCCCFCCLGAEELWSEADSSCSGQPIHLWQFLRELLLKPHNYGRCIRWLNKEKGIFIFSFSRKGMHLHTKTSRSTLNFNWHFISISTSTAFIYFNSQFNYSHVYTSSVFTALHLNQHFICFHLLHIKWHLTYFISYSSTHSSTAFGNLHFSKLLYMLTLQLISVLQLLKCFILNSYLTSQKQIINILKHCWHCFKSSKNSKC